MSDFLTSEKDQWQKLSSRKTETVLKEKIKKRKIMGTIHSNANDNGDSAGSKDLGRWRVNTAGRWKWPWQMEIW